MTSTPFHPASARPSPAFTGTSEGPRCRNCQAPLAGPYCAECGQRDLPPDPSLGELLAEAWDAFISLDGKVARSMQLLLLRPGALTTEYLAGRRASLVPPLRLYLVCSVLYFLVSALPDRTPSPDELAAERTTTAHADSIVRVTVKEVGVAKEDRVARQFALRDSERLAILDSLHVARPAAAPLDSAKAALADSLLLERTLQHQLGAHPGWFKRTFFPRFIRNASRATKDQKSFGGRMKEQVPRMMFVLMPAFAALLALAYRSRRRRYPTHLVMSLHLHAFFFAALGVLALFEHLPWHRGRTTLAFALTCWLVAYVPLAFRRVYGGRLRMAVLRAAFVSAVYSVIAGVAVSALALLLIVLY